MRVLHGRPLTEVLEAKRSAYAIIDDLVTGSYHLSGLEGLAFGRPVLCFLDRRVGHVLRELTGSEAPFLDVRLEDAAAPLARLAREPDEARERGDVSRTWIERNWRDADLVRRFVDVYERPETIRRQRGLEVDEEEVARLDREWEARKPRRVKAAQRAGAAYRRLPWPLRRRVRRLLGRPAP